MASVNEKEVALDREVRLYLSNPSNMEAAAETVLNDLVDSVVLGIVFEIHRAAKIGLMDNEDGIPDEKLYERQLVKKRAQKCTCPICPRRLGAKRFARHLSVCMGLTVPRSVRANRPIQINNDSVRYSETDDDSGISVTSYKSRKKRDLNGTRRAKNQKTGRKGDVTLDSVACSELSGSNVNYDSMTNEEKKNLLMQICGVISVNTRKLCTRSMHCAQHSDVQRRAVRAALLNSQGPEINCTPDLLQVDVDLYEDTDGQSMHESLGQSWEQEHSNTSSPADSASTSSSSSKKREKHSKSQE